MYTAIQVVWWIGLVGALLLTLVILKEVALVLRALAGIERLVRVTGAAAAGVARNVEGAGALGAAHEPAIALRLAVHESAGSVGAVRQLLVDAAEGG